MLEISKINKVYLNEYNLDKIEFIKQISNKFNNYSLKITNFLNRIEDTQDINLKIDYLINNNLIEEIKDCYKKIEKTLSNENLLIPSYLDILY